MGQFPGGYPFLLCCPAWITRSLVAQGSNSQTRTKIQFHWSLEKWLHLNQPKKRTLRFCYSFSILDILFQTMMSGNWILQSPRSPVFPKMLVFFSERNSMEFILAMTKTKTRTKWSSSLSHVSTLPSMTATAPAWFLGSAFVRGYS